MPYATPVAVWTELTQTHDDPLFGAHFAAAIERVVCDARRPR